MVNDVTTELFHTGVWNDITLDVRYDPAITIQWGRANESASASPSSMSLALNNGVSNVAPTVSGRYSPRNPRSDLYGKIGRNTPIRCRMGTRQNLHAEISGREGSYLATPDVAALDIVGDIDVRIDIEPHSWRPTDSLMHLASKWNFSSVNERSWNFSLNQNGTLRFNWTVDGTNGTGVVVDSTAAVPSSSSRLAVRVTLDVNNGAAGKDVKFYTAPTIAGPWTQLGATVTTAGVTSIYSGAAELAIGAAHGGIAFGSSATLVGKVYDFELYNGIAGTLRANPGLSGREPETTSFTGDDGLTWTAHEAVWFPDTSIRFSGEVSSWPPEWDLSGVDNRVNVEASGILRRLGQGATPLKSSLFRDLSTKDDVVAYWPMEDGKNATSLASGIVDHPPMFFEGNVDLSSFDGFVASEPLPVLSTPTSGLTHATGAVPTYTGAANQRVFCLVHVPSGGMPGDRRLLSFDTSGTARRWVVDLQTTGNLIVRAFDAEETQILSSDVFTSNINGVLNMISLWLEQVGANIDFQLTRFVVGATDGAVAESGTLAGHTYGRFTKLQAGPSSFGTDGIAYGHFTVLNDDVHSIWDVIGESLEGWAGETAAERIIRLCLEEGVPVQLRGDLASSALVGPQGLATFLDLVTEAAEADMGILSDARDTLGLRYRTRASLYNQDAALALDYAAGEVAGSLVPVEDDQSTRNDVTVQRPGGSSYRTSLDVGALSTLAPPNGVGRYDDSPTVNTETDAQLPNQAGWRLHLGTVDEARYPQVAVDLTASPSLVVDATTVQPGDRIQVTNPPVWLPPDTIDQLTQGGTEQLTPHRHTIACNCSPASPWTVAVRDNAILAKRDTAGSELNTGITSTATTLAVLVTSGPRWTTTAGDTPFDVFVGGERMTVTASNFVTSVRQDFTVTRSVNGIVKAHAAGAAVRLWQPAVRAL